MGKFRILKHEPKKYFEVFKYKEKTNKLKLWNREEGLQELITVICI